MARDTTRKGRGAPIELENGYIVSWDFRRASRAGQGRVRRFLQGSGRKVNREGFQGIGPATVFVTGDERYYFFRNFLESCDVACVAWPACVGPPSET